MDHVTALFILCGGSGLLGIVVCSLFGSEAERKARSTRNIHSGTPLPRDISRVAWDSTARPVSVFIGTLGFGYVALSGVSDNSLALLCGLVGGAALRGWIGNPRSV